MASLRRNNEYFDVYEFKPSEFKPSLKIQSNDIGDLSGRQSSYSVNFKLPWTAKNKALLDNVGEIGITSSNKKIDNVYIEFGSMSYKGFLRVENSEPNKHYEVYFITDIGDWAEDIKSKKLQELNLDRYNHLLNISNIYGSRNNTEGYIYPFVNYGWWNNHFATVGQPINSNYTRWNQYYPAFYDVTLIKQIFEDIGWSIDANSELFAEPRFQRQVTLFSNGNFENKNTEETVVMSSFIGSQSISVLTKVPPNRVIDKNNNFDDVANKYICPSDGSYVIDNLQTAQSPIPNTELRVFVFKNGSFIYSYPDSSTFYPQTKYDNFSFIANKGDEIELYIAQTGTVSPVTLNVMFYTIKKASEILYNSAFNIVDTLPDMNQIDFVKDIINMYGIAISTDPQTKTVKFDLYKNIVNKKTIAKDWTNKIDLSKPINIDYKTLSAKYGKVNYYTYTTDEDESTVDKYKTPLTDYNVLNPIEKLGNGSFEVDNEFLSQSKTVFKSDFGACIEAPYLSTLLNNCELTYIAHLNVSYIYAGSDIISATIEKTPISTPKKAILVTTNIDLVTNGQVYSLRIYDDSTNFETYNAVPYGYFVKKVTADNRDDINYNLSYSTLPEFNNDIGLLDDYYQNQIDIINKSEIVECYIRMNEADLLNLNFLQPIKINSTKLNGYFIINKIPNLEDINKSIKVELINIG